MKKILFSLSLAMGLAFASIQPSVAAEDTCFVAVRMDPEQKVPFVAKSNGSMIDGVLQTSCPIIKVVNESTDAMRDPVYHNYVVLRYQNGNIPEYDYKKGKGFVPVKVGNMSNFIYFRIDQAKSGEISFQVDRDSSTRRVLKFSYVADGLAVAAAEEPVEQKSETATTESSTSEVAAEEPVDESSVVSAPNAMDQEKGGSSTAKTIMLIIALIAAIGIAVWQALRLRRKQEVPQYGKPYVPGKPTSIEKKSVVTPSVRVEPKKAAKPEQQVAPQQVADAQKAPEVKIVEKVVEVPVERIVEKVVEVPVEKIVEKIVEVPVEKVVEKIIEVPVEKVVEKIVEVPVEKIVEVPVEKEIEKLVNLDPNPEMQRQVESLRTILQQKQIELDEKDLQVQSIRTQSNAAVTEAQRLAQKQVEEAVAEMQNKMNAALAAAQQETEAVKQQLANIQQQSALDLSSEKEKMAAEAAEAKQQAVASLSELQQEFDNYKISAEQRISSAEAAADQKVAEAANAAAQQIAAVEAQIAERVQAAESAAAEKVAAANAEIEQKIAEVQANAEKEAQANKDAVAAELAKAQELADRASEQLLKPLQISRDGLQASLSLIEENILLMREGVEAFNADNNYHNTTMHLAQKFVSFINWFDRNIIQGEASEAKDVEGLYRLMQDTFRRDLENTYSWIAELLRISSYSAISPLFLNEIKRSGIPVDSLKVAASETIALMGRYGITLIIPNLFVDDFERENFRLNNAPLINSFYPKGFKEQEAAKRGVVYDMIRPGYAIGGQVQKVPEVSAMMAIAE